MCIWQNVLRIILISLLSLSAKANIKRPCPELIENFFVPTLNNLKEGTARTTKGIRTPRLVNPQEEMEMAQEWTKTKQPQLITQILPNDTHIINHALNGANEDGVVKTNGGVMAHVRGYVNGVGTNFGVHYHALMDNLFRSKKSFVREEAQAVVVFVHGGGTKTTGHHVAASLMNYLNPYKVDVVSFDLPWHGEGPRNSVENALDSTELVRAYIEKYIAPSGKPVILAGHSMGGVFGDVYRRLYPKDNLIKGIVSLSTVADPAPGETAEAKHAAEMIISEINKTNKNIPEEERALSDSLARQNKIAPLCGAYCSTFMAEVNWAMPTHQGADYIPATYIIGNGDGLYQGYEKSFENYIGKMKNTELVVYGKRRTFGKIKNKITILDTSIPREIQKRILLGTYIGEEEHKATLLDLITQLARISEKIVNSSAIENDQLIKKLLSEIKSKGVIAIPWEVQKKLNSGSHPAELQQMNSLLELINKEGAWQAQITKMSTQERFELRNKILIDLKMQGKIAYDDNAILPELFENDPEDIGHLIFDHKPMVNFGADVPDEVRKRIATANYYGDTPPSEVLKMSPEKKAEERNKALLKLRKEGKVSWDDRYDVDDLNQIETFVLMRQFIQKTIGVKLTSTRTNDVKSLHNVTQAYINNLIFREFADQYIYSHLKASAAIAELGPLRGQLTQEYNMLKKIPHKTDAQIDEMKAVEARLNHVIGVIEEKIAKNPNEQAELDHIIEQTSKINYDLNNLKNQRQDLRTNKENGLYVLKADFANSEKQIAAMGETMMTPSMVNARAHREKVFAELMKQDERVRISLDTFLQKNMINGKYAKDLFKNLPANVKNEFERYEKLSDLYQASVKKFTRTLMHEIKRANPEAQELAQKYDTLSEKINTTVAELENIDKEIATLATKIFKLEARRNAIAGGENFALEHYTVWDILNADPEYIRNNYTEVNSILMNIWKDWQSLWGNRVIESNDSLY